MNAENLAKIFSSVAREAVEAEEIGGTAYAFGSEAAMQRLLYKYRMDQTAVKGYSENRKTFYFSIELS